MYKFFIYRESPPQRLILILLRWERFVVVIFARIFDEHRCTRNAGRTFNEWPGARSIFAPSPQLVFSGKIHRWHSVHGAQSAKAKASYQLRAFVGGQLLHICYYTFNVKAKWQTNKAEPRTMHVTLWCAIGTETKSYSVFEATAILVYSLLGVTWKRIY